MSRVRLGWLLSLVILMAGCSGPKVVGQNAATGSFPKTKPNILFAFADDWGWPHAGSYGDPVVKTPTFDRVAQEGVLFRYAYVSSPSCTPSRSALLTGQWHWRLEESGNLWSTLNKKYPVYPDLLGDNGYHVGYERKGWGPGKIEVGGRKTNPAGPKYGSFKQFMAKRPDGKPFCYWFGSNDPHRGYKKGSGKASGMPLDKIKLPAFYPDLPEIRSDIADYYFEVQRFDREVGAMLKLLEDAGELDNTIVVISGDHGMPFPRCKSTCYEWGARVPLAIRWPKGIKGGREITDLVSLTDLAPTFLEAAGVAIPKQMTGVSLRPQLVSSKSGKITNRPHVLFGKERHVPSQEKPNSGGYPIRAIRTDDFLYIHNFKPDRWPAGTPNDGKAWKKGSWYGDVDPGPTKNALVSRRNDPKFKKYFDWSFAKVPSEQLFDVKSDPDNIHNLAADPSHAAIKKKLFETLMAELKATADPRVLGMGDRFDRYPYYGGTPTKKGFQDGIK
jgi:N-sulfoglucosamine sulfohydrolase